MEALKEEKNEVTLQMVRKHVGKCDPSPLSDRSVCMWEKEKKRIGKRRSHRTLWPMQDQQRTLQLSCVQLHGRGGIGEERDRQTEPQFGASAVRAGVTPLSACARYAMCDLDIGNASFRLRRRRRERARRISSSCRSVCYASRCDV
eukprot:3647737-Rhodomonas_salina.5